MNFHFTGTQTMVRDMARTFAAERLAPGAEERDERQEFPREVIAEMGSLGLLGMMVPERYGGAGLDTVSYALAMTEIARADAAVAVIMSVNNSLICWGLNTYGTEEQKEMFLRDVAAGTNIGAFCLSEPEAGSDASNLRTTARRDGDAYVINGTKNWITNGSTAGTYIVMASTDRSRGAHGISAFIVPRGTPGLLIGKKERKLGLRASDTVSLSFEECRIPASYRIGEEGAGLKFALTSLDGGRIGIAAQALGIASAGFDAALRYSGERKAFGRPIGGFQGIQMKLAEMAVAVEAARLLVFRAAQLKDRHVPFGREAAMAKLYASRTAVQTSLEAIQIHGGYGYVREYHVERYLRDAKATEIYEGTSEIQRLVIARSMIK